jgi:DNA-binding beta-propeller fold protein YncE
VGVLGFGTKDRGSVTARRGGAVPPGVLMRASAKSAALLLLVLCLLAVSAVPASAEVSHSFQSQISSAGEPLEPFVQPWGLTFDAEGNLLVADAGPLPNRPGGAIDIFNPVNAFVPPQVLSTAFSGPYTRGVAVSAATGDLYVAESNPENVLAFKSEGGHKYKLVNEDHFGGYVYVAVDNSTNAADKRKGDVYVLNNSLHVLKPGAEGRLEGEGELVAEGLTPGGGNQNDITSVGQDGLSIDAATGNVYVADPGHHLVKVFNDEGVEQASLA